MQRSRSHGKLDQSAWLAACLPFPSCLPFPTILMLCCLPRRCRPLATHRTLVPIDHATTTINVTCSKGFEGTIVRECGEHGWVDTGMFLPATAGRCVRKHCPILKLNLTSDRIDEPEHVARDDPLRWASRWSVIVTLPEAAEGAGRVTVGCPEGYYGTLSAVCAPDADAWSEVALACKLSSTDSTAGSSTAGTAGTAGTAASAEDDEEDEGRNAGSYVVR
jgi:hypothetical protein